MLVSATSTLAQSYPDLRVWVIVDGPGAGTLLMGDRGEVTTFHNGDGTVGTIATSEEGCDDFHYHGTLAGEPDPNEDGCGWGRLTLGSSVQRARSFETLARRLVEDGDLERAEGFLEEGTLWIELERRGLELPLPPGSESEESVAPQSMGSYRPARTLLNRIIGLDKLVAREIEDGELAGNDKTLVLQAFDQLDIDKRAAHTAVAAFKKEVLELQDE